MKKTDLSNYQLTFLVLLRWLIGWHLLYEGLVKLTNPAWSSKAYLASAEGLFAGFFHTLAQSEGLLRFVDYMNMWGLAVIGFCLIQSQDFCYLFLVRFWRIIIVWSLI